MKSIRRYKENNVQQIFLSENITDVLVKDEKHFILYLVVIFQNIFLQYFAFI